MAALELRAQAAQPKGAKGCILTRAGETSGQRAIVHSRPSGPCLPPAPGRSPDRPSCPTPAAGSTRHRIRQRERRDTDTDRDRVITEVWRGPSLDFDTALNIYSHTPQIHLRNLPILFHSSLIFTPPLSSHLRSLLLPLTHPVPPTSRHHNAPVDHPNRLHHPRLCRYLGKRLSHDCPHARPQAHRCHPAGQALGPEQP